MASPINIRLAANLSWVPGRGTNTG